MKKILITGVNSYIGTSFREWLSQYPDKYSVDVVSMRNDSWKEKSLSKYDAILHTAAIVHVKENNNAKYSQINRDLTLELAKKAKEDGVKQFIFLSTMGVYGTETGHITEETTPSPKTPYAQSKYEAELLLFDIQTTNFNISILRPPIVYGRNCPGNYARLAKIAIKLPVFPAIENERSMIYIDNLSEFIRIIVDANVSGIYTPQNKYYVRTTDLITLVAKAHDKKIKTTRLFNWIIEVGLKLSTTMRKVFGSFTYDQKIIGNPETVINRKKIDYEVVSFKESIMRTEGRCKANEK